MVMKPTPAMTMIAPRPVMAEMVSSRSNTPLVMVVTGSNVNYDEDGNLVGIMDAGWIADAVNTAAAEQGVGKAHYIRGNNSGYSD